MSIKSLIVPRVAEWITSDRRRDKTRVKAEQARLKNGLPHQIDYFHQTDDPYSALVVQRLAEFDSRYDIELQIHLTPPPPDWAAPERQKLEAWSVCDTKLVAKSQGCQLDTAFSQTPPQEQISLANRILLKAVQNDQFTSIAPAVSTALWQGQSDRLNTLAADHGVATDAETGAHITEAAMHRETLGHYLGATFHYGGEWYWGLDRLHYLEERLIALGAARDKTVAPLVPAKHLELRPGLEPVKDSPPIEFWASLRSPYTAIIARRVFELGRHYGVPVKLRPVLPMAMRGLPVPKYKRLYIVSDVKREANRLGMPFGRVCDPLGKPVERGMAVMAMALDQGKEEAFLLSFLEGVWTKGLDAGSNGGLRNITEQAGLDWPAAKSRLTRDDWRPMAEDNRIAMFDAGLWGVPSLRFGDTAVWGQDRLWLIEQAILEHLGKQP